VAALSDCLRHLTAAEHFDAVHADQLWMAQYALAVPAACRLLDNHNAVFRIFERLADGERNPFKHWVLAREAGLLARYEAACLTRFEHTWFVSEEDRAAVLAACAPAERMTANGRSSVIPICLPVADYSVLDVPPTARRITVLGTMYWPPNVEGTLWFDEHVWPRVLGACPDAVLTIIGKQPPPVIRALARQYGAAVEIKGYVADPLPLLRETAVFLVPLRSGGGMRVKILEAWAWGLPIVSTAVGAEGIAVRPDEDILIADDPDAFAAAVIGLLSDPARRSALGRAGRRAVEARYDADTVYDELGAVYGQLGAI
jgi:glycosyltransferase involved in cell wall biosynthesis